MDSESYAVQKNAFVSNHSGASIWQVNLVCLTAATSYAFWIALPRSLKNTSSAWTTLSIEVSILGLPLLAVLTLAAEHATFLNAALVLSTVACHIFFQPVKASGLAFKSKNVRRTSSFSGSKADSTSSETPRKRASFSRSFVTVYRSHMMLLTIICILAVDFHVFPRKFAKCEVWGTSVMDLGVGSFVYSLGLVQSLPILRNVPPGTLSSRCISALKNSIGVLILGAVRILMVKGTSYPGEHVTEYGVHWNFYFTLALLPIAGSLLRGLWPRVSYFSMAMAISLVHQGILSLGGLQNWVLTAQRTGLISANKEGLASLPGYISLFLFGVDAGLYALPPEPFWAYKSAAKRLPAEEPPRVKKTLTVMATTAAGWWLAVGALSLFGTPASMQVSRVLANLPYTLWVSALNISILSVYLLVQVSLISHLPQAPLSELVPQTFTAVNKNGLLVFLVANLLTGIVNLSMNTLTASSIRGFSVVTVYMLSVLVLAWLLRNTHLRL